MPLAFRLANPFLCALDAERAHRLAITALRLLPQADMPEMDCFLVYTEELKNVARVHAFRDFLISTAQRWRY